MRGRPGRASKLLFPSIQASRSSRTSRTTQCTEISTPAVSVPDVFQYYNPSRRRNYSSFVAAVTAAQQLLGNAAQPSSSPISVDPFRMVAKEMKFLTNSISKLVGSGHPSLDTIAKYYTQSEGKHIRPLLVLLMSRATKLTSKHAAPGDAGPPESPDKSITPLDVLSDDNPCAPENTPLTSAVAEAGYRNEESDILPTQRRLAEIVELIHTATLLHDDVIDHALTRRSNPSANIAFGNKMAVLAGDFMLGRASVMLARLRNPEVIELLGTVLANLVEGEFMQLKNTAQDEKNPVWTENTVSYYIQKTYLKSASLISKSCRAAAVLGECTPEVVEAAYMYGKNLGLAFQLVDDMLDYTITAEELGKPAGADLHLGLATAPLLFAWKDNADLGPLVGRKFMKNGDVQKAREIVARSSGLEQTRVLAQDYIDKAIQAISWFPECEAKEGLMEMCTKVMKRRK